MGLPVLLEEVSLSVGGRCLLDRVSLCLDGLDRTVILGPNGAGKTVLLRLCHGLIAPESGRITWAGQPPCDGGRRRQAMVFQRPVLLRRSALDNVAYPLKLVGMGRGQRDQAAWSALAQFGLTALAATPARHLSGGEQQRLALARAWTLQPHILFLDEVTAALDPASTFYVEQAVQAFQDRGTKVVMVTHDLAQARRMAQDIVFMSDGRVVEQGKAHDFFHSPQTRQAQAYLAGDLFWQERPSA